MSEGFRALYDVSATLKRHSASRSPSRARFILACEFLPQVLHDLARLLVAHLHEIRIGAAVLVLDDQRRPVPAAILVQGLVLWAIVMLESPHQTARSVHRR